MYTDEKQVAKAAEQLLTNALQAKIGTLGFKAHKSGVAGKTISDAKGSSDWKFGNARDGGVRAYMNKLSVSMPKYGYIQNYGDIGTRSGGTRTRYKPKTTTYTFRTHEWNLPETDWIAQAIRSSNVVGFVMDNLTQIRGEAILISLRSFFEDPDKK